MLDQLTLRGRIVTAALRLAARRPWHEVTLRDISEEAGTPLIDLKDLFASKSEIVASFVRSVDEEMLRRAPKRTAGESARDAVFEVLMTRLDVLQPHKDALRSIVASPAFDPVLVQNLLSSQRWMLHAAGVGAEGVRGACRVAGLASVYASVFRIWLADDDPGLARTMAALDRRLRRGERSLSAIEDACAAFARLVRVVQPRPKSRTSAETPGADSAGTAQL